MDSNPTPTARITTDQSAISAANRGPVTTFFVPPPECTAALTMRDGGNLYFGYSAAGYFDPSCYPSGTLSRNFIVNDHRNNYYYSPAICPLDWTAVATSTSSSIFDTRDFVTILPETTAIICCPSGYTYARLGHVCGSTVAPGQKYSYVSPSNDGTGYIRGPTRENFALSSMTVEGNGVPAWWQQSDEPALSRASTATPPTTTQSTATSLSESRSQASGSQTSTISANSSTSTQEPLSQSNGGLPTGAKIGLGVGIPVVVIAALALGIFLWRRRKSQTVHANAAPAYVWKSDAYIAQPTSAYIAPVEIYTAPAEVPADFHGRHELLERSK